MSGKNVVTIPVGAFETNCHLVFVPEKKKLFIVDPGAEAGDIADAAKAFPYKEAVILFTHAHVDHISGAGSVAKLTSAKRVCLHPDDAAIYSSRENAIPPYYPPAKDLPELSPWPPKDEEFEIIHTPGHTPGGVCYCFRNLNLLLSGDTLFRESAGRTDLPGGSDSALMESLKKLLATLPEDMEVRPGHGPATTIGYEKENNPYVQL